MAATVRDLQYMCLASDKSYFQTFFFFSFTMGLQGRKWLPVKVESQIKKFSLISGLAEGAEHVIRALLESHLSNDALQISLVT